MGIEMAKAAATATRTAVGFRFRAVVVGGPDQDPEQPTRTMQVLERDMDAVAKWAAAVLVGPLANAKVYMYEQKEELSIVLSAAV